MPRLLTVALLLTITAACAEPAPAPRLNPAPAPRVDPARVTVSGISAGGHMAHQLHIAYSDIFSGAAIIAGGPFGCAQGSVATAFARCIATTGGKLSAGEFIDEIGKAAGQGLVADTRHLADDRVWLFHGSLDKVVAGELSDILRDEYLAFVPAENIVYVNDVPAAHSFPARGAGHACGEFEPPYVGNCDYDAAGQLLQQLYPGLEAPTAGGHAALGTVELAAAAAAGLEETAFLYVPAQCAAGSEACALHLVLHGCAQSSVKLGTAFIEQSGYLPWAEANDIVLAFPQIAPSVVNPMGCWDWWGYTGPGYRWRDGAQMKLLADWVRSLAGLEG